MVVYFKDLLTYVHTFVPDNIFQAQVKAIAEQIAANFKESRDWVYQTQLMLNAYITEKYTLNILNSYTYWDTIAEHLAIEGYRGAPAASFRFNNIPNMHEAFSAELAKAELSDSKNYFDIIASDDAHEDMDAYSIEVKATVVDPMRAENFHNADIVFIYMLDKKELYFRYKMLYTHDYSEPILLDNNLQIPAVKLYMLENKLCAKHFSERE